MIQEAMNTLMDIIKRHPVVENIMIEKDQSITVLLNDGSNQFFNINDAQEMIEWIEEQKI